jgi:hypothetical protein
MRRQNAAVPERSLLLLLFASLQRQRAPPTTTDGAGMLIGRRDSSVLGGVRLFTSATSAASSSGCSQPRPEARQPPRTRRGSRARHQVRDACTSPRLPGPRAARGRTRDVADVRAGTLHRDGGPARPSLDDVLAEMMRSSTGSKRRFKRRTFRISRATTPSTHSSSTLTAKPGAGDRCHEEQWAR